MTNLQLGKPTGEITLVRAVARTQAAVGAPKSSPLRGQEGFPEGLAFELGLKNEACQVGGVG